MTEESAANLRLGGTGDDPAITWAGRTVNYAEFDRLVDHFVSRIVEPKAFSHPSMPLGATPCAGASLHTAGLGVIDALATVFAAARAGVPVIAQDSEFSGLTPEIGKLPPDTFLVAITSGSTGRPRAISRTLQSWTSSFEPLAHLAGLSANDTVLLTGPLHSTLHLFAAVHTLWLGGQLTDRSEHATAVHAVPTVARTLLDDLPPAAPLQRMIVAGAALPADLAAHASTRGIDVLEYYGAAELSFVAARRPPAAFRPFPGVQVRVDDGVLFARSPFVAAGYIGAQGFTPIPCTADGFATAGDLGEFTPDGSVRVRGRGSTAVTVGGATVIVEDVEAVLVGLPGVIAAAAIGLPHPRFGELLTAALELTEGGDLTLVRAAARLRLRAEALPRKWIVMPVLPRTAGGKIARAQLVEQLIAADPMQVAGPFPTQA